MDVLIGGITSAPREAIRPIVDRVNALYFCTNQYEGGECEGNMTNVGAVPEQQLSTVIPWMFEKFGKRVYTVAAAYNFGQTCLAKLPELGFKFAALRRDRSHV